MDLNSSNEDLSDDEIYFGKFSIKEIKKHIYMSRNRQSISCLPERRKESPDGSFTLIETTSEPSFSKVTEINSPDHMTNSCSNFSHSRLQSTESDMKSSDDSFIRLEKMVTDLCISPKQDNDQVLDNTLDVVDFILNNVPLRDNIDVNNKCILEDDKSHICASVVSNSDMNEEKSIVNIKEDKDFIETKYDINIVAKEENAEKNIKKNMGCREPEIKGLYNKTPNKVQIKHDHIFKTPKNILSCKKQLATSVKKIPGKSSAYQHISSPIASYIKNSPQIPLLQAVHPKKPLPGISSIPKLAKPIENKIDKENIRLPSLAYKSAKKTKLVPAPENEKLPQGQRVKKLITSLPKPVVIKHDHRHVNSSMKNVHTTQEDSFANLTLHQADLSVCTQKSAFAK